ncbi:MAG: RNA-binding transcriptional accessory protein [Bacteroidales bacterium]|nr:RNA-binding transcriptional accessory protein [Bacteroidales bacterium]
MNKYITQIASELGITSKQVQNTITLFDEGATIPFIARYRKERTESLDEVQITNIRDRIHQLQDLDKRRKSIIESIKEQDKLTKELEKLIIEAQTLSELEDIYLPFKPKRKTRAIIAKSKGLEPLAKMIISQKYFDIEEKAYEFIDKEKEVNSVEEAIAGASDIIAEWINENKSVRAHTRRFFEYEAVITSKVIIGKNEEGIKYKTYFDWEEALMRSPSHRILAMFRGEKEGYLKIKIKIDEEKVVESIERIYIKSNNQCAEIIVKAIKDSYKRLIFPSLETEIRTSVKEKADREAIKVFAENLRQLLLAPPLGDKNILAIDPGFRSGCKVVCLDKQGKLLHNENIYPHPPQRDSKQAMHKIISLVNAYKIEAIAIGNGTAGRETENFIKKIKFEKKLIAVMVNENGASIYSASSVGREEFPEYDVTVRGAVSIGRRLMDPLAELVKIEPKSIGVGQYQHDVNQTALHQSLEDVVVSCVNSVGVNVNSASKQLLTYVSGLGPVLAKNILDYRNKNGAFKSRDELKNIPRFGNKAFELAAGFLRIPNSENPLDNSAVHPESYSVVKKMANKSGASIKNLNENQELRNKINLNDFITDKIGLPTLKDILDELAKPGRDPRKKFAFFEFTKGVNQIEDLKEGMKLSGIVTNITAFGAFVDIGVHQDGLVHISCLADEFISDPNTVVKINQKVDVKVLEVDIKRKRIQLSMRE